MNTHSKRWWPAIVLTVVVAGACGGSSSGSATTKAGWTKSHGKAVTALSDDITTSNQALDAGQRPDILAACNMLTDDLATARKSVPVPDPTVDGALRTALDATGTAATDCLAGARAASDAKLTEQAMREIKDARLKMDAANKAIDSWQ